MPNEGRLDASAGRALCEMRKNLNERGTKVTCPQISYGGIKSLLSIVLRRSRYTRIEIAFNQRDFRKDKAKPVNLRTVCSVKNTHFLKGQSYDMAK
jgi:hypothetical protein